MNDDPQTPSRRRFLQGALAAALAAALPRRAEAFGEPSRLSFALLRHGGRWDVRPEGLPRLSWEISRRTSIDTSPQVRPLGFADPELFHHPFAVLSSDQAVPMPSDDPALREDEDPLEPGDLDLGMAPRLEPNGEE